MVAGENACANRAFGPNLHIMKVTAFLPVCALFASSIALAQQGRDAPNWVRVETGNEQDTAIHIDLNSIRSGNGYRQVWVKDVPVVKRNGVREIRAQYEVDCKDPSTRVLQSRLYLMNGSVEEDNEAKGWANVLPDDRSGLKALHRAVCSAKVAI